MNKSELITEVVARSGLPRKDAESAVAAVFEAMTAALVEKEKIQILGFGTFEAKYRNERMGRNPNTKEEMLIPASYAPTFKAGKTLKDLVNEEE